LLTRYYSLFLSQLDVYGIGNSGNLGERDSPSPYSNPHSTINSSPCQSPWFSLRVRYPWYQYLASQQQNSETVGESFTTKSTRLRSNPTITPKRSRLTSLCDRPIPIFSLKPPPKSLPFSSTSFQPH
jgi:hypothetical protein